MTTDQDLGGHLEVIDNNNVYVTSNLNQIVLSIDHYTGNVWPKILRTRLSEHVNIDLYAKELVR